MKGLIFKFRIGLISVFLCASANALELSGTAQIAWVEGDEAIAFYEGGTGVLRYQDSSVNLVQNFIQFDQEIDKQIQITAVVNYYPDGDQHAGITQLFASYKPLTGGSYKFKARAGFFYPKFSFENVDRGWLSPYTYTQSAINSWIGEELRISGLELSTYSPGRTRNSPWSWQLTAAVYMGNDPTGTLLAWRGWAMHDRQTLYGEQINFAVYPSVVDRINHPAWVEPYHEVDGKAGWYVGGHLDYLRKTGFRYYYYDNNADPTQLNKQNLYAWHTKFHSLAWQHKFNSRTRLLGQWMDGSSEMGYSAQVKFDFSSWYVMLSHTINEHRFSLRFDDFEVVETDANAWDYNASDGDAVTFAWRYTFDKAWQLGAEYVQNENSATARHNLGQSADAKQDQFMLVAQLKW